MTIRLPDADLTLRPLADNAVRVTHAPAGHEVEASYVLLEPVASPVHRVHEGSGVVSLTMGRLSVVVDRATGSLCFRDGSGSVILSEKPGARALRPTEVRGRPVLWVETAFDSPPDERLYGCGQFQDGYLDIRDLPRRLTQVNTQIAVPILVSSKGYGLLWHNYGLTELNPADRGVSLSPAGAGRTSAVQVTTTQGTRTELRTEGVFAGTFRAERSGSHAFLLDVGQRMARRHHVEIDGRIVAKLSNYWLPPTTSWRMPLDAGEHSVKVVGEIDDAPVLYLRPSADETRLRSPVADALDYVVISGDAVEVVATVRRLTGQAPLPPRWVFGYIHCRERFHTQDEIVATAREFRARGIPMDVMVQDWQYWGRHGWNAMRFDEREYPDPGEMVRGLHAVDARLMVSVWPKTDPASELGRRLADHRAYIPDTDWVDFFDPRAAALYWEFLSRNLLSLGIDALWLDATEPENDDLVGRNTYVGPGERVRAVYPLFVTRAVYEGHRRDAPGRRVFLLTRSAFAGQQRYAAATWSGDVGSDWESLRRQIPAGLGLAVTGMPYWTTDTGGFFRPPAQYTDPAYHECFLRWFQYSTFCPLLRVHGYQTDTELWRYGPAVEQTARLYLDLRYRMLPYIYSEASRVTSRGSTLMRPLVMDFPHDGRALDQPYLYMFGPALLVAPVLQAGVSVWDVYLPQVKGGWYDFWTGLRQAGGRDIVAAAPLERIPLYVRAGTILPLGPTLDYTGQRPADPIELRVYRGADGAFELYEDDGVSYDYERGVCATVPIAWHEETRTLTIGERLGSFPGTIEERTFRVVWVQEAHGGGVAEPPDFDAVVRYTGRAVTVRP